MMLDILAKGIEDKENKFPNKRGTVTIKELSIRGCSFLKNEHIQIILDRFPDTLTALDMGMLKDYEVNNVTIQKFASKYGTLT
jgi:hypothetical protein